MTHPTNHEIDTFTPPAPGAVDRIMTSLGESRIARRVLVPVAAAAALGSLAACGEGTSHAQGTTSSEHATATPSPSATESTSAPTTIEQAGSESTDPTTSSTGEATPTPTNTESADAKIDAFTSVEGKEYDKLPLGPRLMVAWDMMDKVNNPDYAWYGAFMSTKMGPGKYDYLYKYLPTETTHVDSNGEGNEPKPTDSGEKIMQAWLAKMQLALAWCKDPEADTQSSDSARKLDKDAVRRLLDGMVYDASKPSEFRDSVEKVAKSYDWTAQWFADYADYQVLDQGKGQKPLEGKDEDGNDILYKKITIGNGAGTTYQYTFVYVTFTGQKRRSNMVTGWSKTAHEQKSVTIVCCLTQLALVYCTMQVVN